MELNESLYAYLTSHSGLSALISKRIYPDASKAKNETVFPYVTYQLVSESEVDTFIQQTTALISSTYQFDVWGSTRINARDAAKQLRKAFKNLSGQIGGVTGVTLSAVKKVGHTTDIETDANGVVIAYRELLEFEIWHYETA